jgi:hypothetical protein
MDKKEWLLLGVLPFGGLDRILETFNGLIIFFAV